MARSNKFDSEWYQFNKRFSQSSDPYYCLCLAVRFVKQRHFYHAFLLRQIKFSRIKRRNVCRDSVISLISSFCEVESRCDSRGIPMLQIEFLIVLTCSVRNFSAIVRLYGFPQAGLLARETRTSSFLQHVEFRPIASSSVRTRLVQFPYHDL